MATRETVYRHHRREIKITVIPGLTLRSGDRETAYVYLQVTCKAGGSTHLETRSMTLTGLHRIAMRMHESYHPNWSSDGKEE